MSEASNSSPAPKVLYVVGHPRSGSTIFGNLLDEVLGVFHAGELHYLWTPDLPEPRQRCGCGEAVRACSLWRRVFARASEAGDGADTAADGGDTTPAGAATAHGLPGVDAERVLTLQRQAIEDARRGAETPALAEYRRTLARLYRALAAETGSRWIVDSSKWPYDARVVAGIPDLEIHLVHLVREPWGVVFSRLPRADARRAGSGGPPSRARVALESFRWLRSTRQAEALVAAAGRRGHTLRYEDFAADPSGTLRGLLDRLDLRDAPLPLDGHSAELTPNHTVGGNRNRWQSGPVTVRADRKWRQGLRPLDVRLVSLLTWPARRKLGYRAQEPTP